MKYQRGFSIPKHGSWSPVTRGMPVTRESNQDSKTGGNGDTTEKSLLKKKRIAHRNRIVQSRKSWTPVTPEKVKNGRLDIIPVERQPENENWQDLVGKYTGLLKDETMKRDEKSELYFKSNDPANWKCNDLASVVCSKSSIEAHNNEIHLSDKRRITFKRCTYTLGTQKIAFITNGSTSKDEASSSTTTDLFPIAPITPAKQNDIQRVPENVNSPTNGDSPPSTVSTTQKDEQEIDLSKTPQQKTPTRRKRHRPRVIKPKKDPKDGTTPGTPRVKRKYVRKNSVINSNTPDTQQKTPGTSVMKRKYVRKKKNIDQVKSQPQNTTDNPPVKSCKKKLNFDLDINLNVNPQDTEQEKRINSNNYISTHHVMNVLARNMNGYHHNLVPSTIQQIQPPNLPSLDERRGIKRQNSAMDSLFLYKRLLLGVAQRSHNHNIFLENYKKRKIMQQSGFQPSTLVHGNVYNSSPMKLLHSCGQIVNPPSQPPVFVMQPLPNTIIPNEGFTYGVITYPAALFEKKQSEVNGLRVDKGGVSIDDVIYKLERTHICDDSKKRGNQKELVLFRGSDGNAIVPFEPIRKRIQRPKVDLDPETDRLWKLLLAKEGSEGGGGGETLDKDKEKWWENERKVFRGRADSFIARMHLVQGDRRFSRWKGSVVDSVIGVFLTQNVSDHLSSSAFMALAAKFPVKTRSQDEECEKPKEVAEEKVTIKTEPGSEDSIESTTSQTVDETRSTSAPKSNSEPEDVKTEQKQDSNPTVEEGTTPIKSEANSQEQPSGAGEGANTSKEKKRIDEDERNRSMNWDSLRQQAVSNGENKEKSKEDARDSIDYEAFRHAPVNEISDVIKERGMNNLLADRMKYFLNRLVSDHGKIDLEWLRDAPPEKAKDYLLSFRGLGLKSVECIRLLTLHHLAFPVDTNVARISVRLGWVPLQPLPESLQLHLLEMYPVLDSIQKYLWPRLCKLDQLTLYELHYQMITFGKIFCTKSKPNCNACPMRTECRHFASAFASARLSLPGPEEKKIVTTNAQIPTNPIITPLPLEGEGGTKTEEKKCEPIIEEPTTPEPEATEVSLSDIEDQYYEDSDEIPTIKLNMEQFTTNLQNIMQNNKELQGDDMSKALVALSPKAAYIPIPKLKDVGRLRTEHQVYELPDSHRLLEGLEKREPDDPSPYLLAIWTPGETANSVQPPERECPAQETGSLCDKTTCFSCNSIKEANSQVVRGTILIPCRTAMRGSFPLNGTYFQVNEMFADHASSLNPIDVPRSWIWNLPRRTVYFGTSVSTIFRVNEKNLIIGLSTQGIQYCFWKGFVCVRGFDRETRAPRPLMARLHFPASKLIKIKSEGK
ncbi:hypothetical protein LXL04_012871 [Taraxacum kok-saghyz]